MPKIITPADHAKSLKERRGIIRPEYIRQDDRIAITIRHAPFSSMTAQERCDLLGAVAAHLRTAADEADEWRLEIAQEELTA